MKKSEVRELIEKNIPTNWLHPIMEESKIIGQSPHYARDIERLCLMIKKNLLRELDEVRVPKRFGTRKISTEGIKNE